MSDFALDRVDNPHPRMLATALRLRAEARQWHTSGPGARWQGYLEAMCDATGCTPAAMNAWLDRQESDALPRDSERTPGA